MDERPKRQFRRLKTLCAALVVFGCVSTTATSIAQQPDDGREGGESAAASTSEDKQSQMTLILLGSLCAMGLGMLAGYVFVRRRNKREPFFDFDDDAQYGSFGFQQSPRTLEASSATVERSTEETGSPTEAVMEALGQSTMDYGQGQGNQMRECPRCSREFEATMVVCPYDSTPLRPVQKARSRRRRKSTRHLDRLVCQGCDRRYTVGLDYCYHDGMPLVRDTEAKAVEAPAFRACENCGWEGTDQEVCPRDGSELVEIDPADTTRVRPTIPLTICPKCREYGPPGKAHCPNDGTMLTPLVDVRVTEFPRGGFGPRRKICKECGEQFSSAARYCSHDGTRLVALN